MEVTACESQKVGFWGAVVVVIWLLDFGDYGRFFVVSSLYFSLVWDRCNREVELLGKIAIIYCLFFKS